MSACDHDSTSQNVDEVCVGKKAAGISGAFVPYHGNALEDVLCAHDDRKIGCDSHVSWVGRPQQMPRQTHRITSGGYDRTKQLGMTRL